MKLLGRRSKNAEQVPRRRQGTDSQQMVRPAGSDLANRNSFRRNRTLTGSSSAKVASSGELNAELRSPRAHVHHLTTLRRRLTFYFVTVCFGAFGLYILISQLVASLSVQITGVELVPPADKAAYQTAVESYYAARPTERLRFLLNETALTAHVQATRPEVERVAISPGSELSTAVVTITPRKAIARWSFEDDADRYVDAHGVVFLRNYQGTPLLKIVDKSGIRSTSTRVVASNRFLSFVGQVISGTESYKLKVAKVTIPAFTTRQVTLTMKGERTQYRLSVDRLVGEQVEDIARIHTYLKRKSISPRYVDVRVKGKAFYQ